MLKLQAIIVLTSLVLTLYTFIDCARREDTQIQKLPKWGWLLLIVLLSPFGAIAYLILGRINGGKGPRPPKRRILPPDDDPDFLRKL
ncbi:unannotated protein [freshwater metagenome]|jgi:hypothetical protein|uniref:Unannotated protein n=1 Tax=freshwater metagenome TaxID=449393 RepID=A0A6J5Z612_9ZZZZ|nr:hypothetical protein [Actinomycetota bacterium]